MTARFEEVLKSTGKPTFINVGARDFAEAIREAGAEVVHVDWSPPARTDAEIADLLNRLL